MEFYEKLVAIQSDLKAPKDKVNKFSNFKYRSCEGILEAVKPLLAQHALYLNISDEIVQIGDRYYVKAKATIMDGTNAQTAIAWAREEDSKKGMDAAQLTGATSSYARKYALNALFGIDDAKDPDTDEFQKQTRSSKKEKPQDISFGTASEAVPEPKDAYLPFDVCDPEPIELLGLRSLMKQDGITEEQILEAFKGKYSAIENIEPEVITKQLLDKWESFITYIKGGNKT